MTRAKKEAECPKCKKVMRSTDLARHKKTCGVKKERKKKESKGKFFFMTFQKAVKYRLAMRLKKKDKAPIQSYCIGN